MKAPVLEVPSRSQSTVHCWEVDLVQLREAGMKSQSKALLMTPG